MCTARDHFEPGKKNEENPGNAPSQRAHTGRSHKHIMETGHGTRGYKGSNFVLKVQPNARPNARARDPLHKRDLPRRPNQIEMRREEKSSNRPRHLQDRKGLVET
jgi:hypothetical protein